MLFKKSKVVTKLEESIDTAQTQLDSYDADSPEYDKILKQLERLHTLLHQETGKNRISPDALLGAGVTIGTVLIIVVYEQLHPFISKGIGFIPKPKI